MLGIDTTTYCLWVIAMGGLVYGIDTGIVTTTIAHESFKLYMYGTLKSRPDLVGAIVSTYYAGNCVGSFVSGELMDRWGRRSLVFLATFFAILGTAIQTGSINVGMMIAGRTIAGLATGALLTVVPVYIAELAPPENRAYLVAIKGFLTAIGYLVAHWVGYAGSYAVGDAQWRIPLAMQVPPAILLLVLTLFLPHSPRWLVSRERYEEAAKVLSTLHAKRGEDFIRKEMTEIRGQLALEQAHRSASSWVELFSLRYARRLLLACFTLNMLRLSGGGVVQNYQSIFYNDLGYQGRTVLLLSGCFGFTGVIGQVANMIWISDKWPRVRTMNVGSALLALFLILLVIMTHLDSHNSNIAGVAFIYLYSTCFAAFFNSTNWVIAAEIFPLHLRGNGNSFAVFSMSLTNIWLSQITPQAFATLGWRFYLVFIALNIAAIFVYWMWLPETNQLTLEEIAGAFGDEVVSSEKLHMKSEATEAEHVAPTKQT